MRNRLHNLRYGCLLGFRNDAVFGDAVNRLVKAAYRFVDFLISCLEVFPQILDVLVVLRYPAVQVFDNAIDSPAAITVLRGGR